MLYRTYDESRNLLQRLRLLGNMYLFEFQKKFNTFYNAKFDQAIARFTQIFISKLKNDREKKAIRSFLEAHYAKLREIAEEASLGLSDKFDEFRKDVINELDDAIDSLDKDCTENPDSIVRRYDICPRKLGNYLKLYQKEYESLNSEIGYDPDILILFDYYYYLKNRHIKSNICFITEDREHFLSKKTEIEEVFVGICIQPTRFPCAEHFCLTTPSYPFFPLTPIPAASAGVFPFKALCGPMKL